ncbi:DUF3387 domain-containing protein [Mammaliicoccus sciuri]|uniref:DUF3387 domain-containing protein n=1 Tax=Mammaliicoccus sciuri TaxID=1296 RepID=UPI001C12BE25|nr:DUF3387 domain-containing protein [Mammaliicoccus sciuri]
MNNYEEKYKEYVRLLNMSYKDAVATLITKYGTVTDNYYVEISYQKFLNSEIFGITKGKYQKTKDGLYCHHIMEDRYENLSNEEFIKNGRYPYKTQLAENLVYCNAIEHLILHVLISEQTKGEFGTKGLVFYIQPEVIYWYSDKIEPTAKWKQVCKAQAYIPDYLFYKFILKVLDKLKENTKYIEYNKENNFTVELMEEIFNMLLRNYEKELKEKSERMTFLNISEDEYNENKEQILREEQLMNEAKKIYTSLEEIKNSKVPRQVVINILAYLGSLVPGHYLNSYTSDTLKKNKINVVKDVLIEEIKEVSTPIIHEIENMKYYDVRVNKIPTELIKKINSRVF